MKAPSFLRRPPLVVGIPIVLAKRDFNAETPTNRQIEKPPRFIVSPPLKDYSSINAF